jgi:glycosyltransferase involved in cell wall biosynthesis
MTLPSVAILNPASHIGGAEISLLELLSRTSEHFQFHLVLPENGPLKERAENVGVKVWIVRWPEKLLQLGERGEKKSFADLFQAAVSTPFLLQDVSRLLKYMRCEALISNGIKCHVLGSLISKKDSCPLIWYLRDGLEERRLTSFLLKLSAPGCLVGIAISEFVASESRQLLRKGLPIHVLYNIVDLESFRPGLPCPADLKKDEGEMWFGMIGAITPLKGQDLFLAAADRVVRAMPNARFIIAGSNFYRTERDMAFDYENVLRMQARSPSLRGRVLFLGFRDDIPATLSTLDVLIQPNRGPEGLGRSILEAMACEVPVVAVDRWGPAELIRDGHTGLLFPWMNTEALAHRMIQLGTELALRRRLGVNARHWIHTNLNPRTIADRFVSILNDAISRSS